MKTRPIVYIAFSSALLFALAGCFGASSNPTTSTLSTAGPSGNVAQGPVSGATVWADSLGTGTRFVIDSAEQSTQATTSATGAYTIPVTPSYKYILVSQGGIDTLTNRTANTLLAPGGSQSISPLTTLVVLDTSGNIVNALNALLPAGKTFDSDITAAGGLTPAAMVLLASITTAITTFDAALQSAIGNNAMLTSQQINNISLTLFSQIAVQFSTLSSTSLSTPASLASNLQTALSNGIALISTNNPNVRGLSAGIIAPLIANNAVAIASNVVGNAIGNADLQGVTTGNVQGKNFTVSNANSITESSVISSSNAKLINDNVNATATSTATSITVTATPSTYSPQAVAVISNPTVIGYRLDLTGSNGVWNVSNFTITFSDDMVATTSGGTNYIHSVLNSSNYQFTQTGCSPSSYASNVVTFKCGSLEPGTFGVSILSASSSGGVWAGASSLGLPVMITKTFTLPAVTGSTGGTTGGSGLSLF